jgi:hypothetical protein
VPRFLKKNINIEGFTKIVTFEDSFKKEKVKKLAKE